MPYFPKLRIRDPHKTIAALVGVYVTLFLIYAFLVAFFVALALLGVWGVYECVLFIMRH